MVAVGARAFENVGSCGPWAALEVGVAAAPCLKVRLRSFEDAVVDAV